MTIHHFDAPADAQFSVDAETRTIRGLALPFGKTARSGGALWQFEKGTLAYSDVSRVKLFVQHDAAQAVGYATKLEETDEGLIAEFKVARGPEGDRALSLAEDHVLDGLSVGIGNGAKFRAKDGVQFAVVAPLAEISLTPTPAFDDARVLAVAASADLSNKEIQMENENTVEAAPDFSAVTDAIKAGFEGLQTPQREVVSAAGAAPRFDVSEPTPYRFDGTKGSHSFVEDMRDAQQGNQDARARLAAFSEEFAKVQFAVTTSNASTLNPTQNRPDLYVPNLAYTRPLWESVSTGTITDKTPFTVPKFGSASGLVGAHTEGVEPTPGAFAATSMTVTPGALSGKIEINREVLDQGGSPQADSIIWAEMLNGYYEAVEARIATALGAVATAEVNFASATGSSLISAVENVLLDLQYTRGGNRFTGLALDGQLFKALAGAADTTGRPLLPITGPANADGQLGGGFDRISIGSLTGRAAWALGSSNASKSYLFVPSSVWAWASAPQRFEFQYQVKSVDLAIWGYAATAVLRDSDVKPLDYTTADI